jgi:hypothetical protein
MDCGVRDGHIKLKFDGMEDFMNKGLELLRVRKATLDKNDPGFTITKPKAIGIIFYSILPYNLVRHAFFDPDFAW